MSNVPLRRTTHTTRPVNKDIENANARPSRVLTRSKALAASQDARITMRATAPTLASMAKSSAPAKDNPRGKRKREVLVEVTDVTNNNVEGGGGMVKGIMKGKASKGREEIKQGAVSKLKQASKPVRESLRTLPGPVASRTQRTASVTTTSTQGTDEILKNAVNKEAVTVDRGSSRLDQCPPIQISSTRPPLVSDDAETGRVFKRRHTQSPIDIGVQDDSQADADKIAAELVAIEEESEGKPQLWDDLDEGDWDDPTMVSEYVAEVCVYLKQVELATLPNPNYMNSQSELDWEKRGILVDWVLQVHARFQMLQETLFLFINILDRFLSARPVALSKLQLVGVTCFFIAAKFEETYTPSVKEIAYLTDGQATVEDVLKAERYILKTINWDLNYPGPMGWLRRGSKADDCEFKARTVAKYLLEIGCLEWRLVATLPSLLAAAALWLARLALGREEWTPNLEYYTTYSEASLLPTANIILNYILEPVQHLSLFQKYAHKRHLKCSIFMRQWARMRWEEGANVDLAKALPEIKAEIGIERERESAIGGR